MEGVEAFFILIHHHREPPKLDYARFGEPRVVPLLLSWRRLYLPKLWEGVQFISSPKALNEELKTFWKE